MLPYSVLKLYSGLLGVEDAKTIFASHKIQQHIIPPDEWYKTSQYRVRSIYKTVQRSQDRGCMLKPLSSRRKPCMFTRCGAHLSPSLRYSCRCRDLMRPWPTPAVDRHPPVPLPLTLPTHPPRLSKYLSLSRHHRHAHHDPTRRLYIPVVLSPIPLPMSYL